MSETIKKLCDAIAKKAAELNERQDAVKKHSIRLAPLLAELETIGCEPYFSDAPWMYVSLAGDKHKFLSFVRVMRKHGFKINPVEKGATGFNQFCNELGDLQLYVSFSSTACRRVKTGTKLVEQDVYETVCDEMMPYGDQPGEAAVVDEIPF